MHGGTPILVKKGFTVGKYNNIAGPHDPKLGPEESVFCRCTMKTTLFDKIELDELYPDAKPPALPIVKRKVRLPLQKLTAETLEIKSTKMQRILDSENIVESAGNTKKRISEELAQQLSKDNDFRDFIIENNRKEILGHIYAFDDPLFEELVAVTNTDNFTKYKNLMRQFSPELKRDFESSFNIVSKKQISDWINQWAITSADEHPISIAFQLATNDEFKIKGISSHFSKKALSIAKKEVYLGNKAKAMRAFVRAQYNITQDFFEKKGVEKVFVYRGMSLKNKIKGFSFDGKVSMPKVFSQPASSFSTNVEKANTFALRDMERPYSMLLSAEIPKRNILSTCQTGWGCKEEAEIVILGGQKQYRIYSFTKRTLEDLKRFRQSAFELFKLFAG